MADARSSYPSEQQRRAFGRTIRIWHNRNNWIHSTMHDWGAQAGFPALKDSSTNRLQNAKTEQPTPLTFIQLAIVNQRVASRDYSGVIERDLLDRLTDSEPICSPDGTPWGAMQFFGHFVGELEPPEWAKPGKEWTAEALAQLSRDHQGRFEQIAKTKLLPPAQAWKELEKHCDALTPKQRDQLRNVLSGWEQWTAEAWEAVASDDDADPVATALAAWDKG